MSIQDSPAASSGISSPNVSRQIALRVNENEKKRSKMNKIKRNKTTLLPAEEYPLLTHPRFVPYAHVNQDLRHFLFRIPRS